MKNTLNTKYYPPAEERINIISHAFGTILSFIALIMLVIHASIYGNIWHIISFSIFGTSLVILFFASTYYHSTQEPYLRSKLRIFDHAAIYILIAGSYTPFTLITLHGTTGWIIFSITWSMAFAGIILKIFFTGKYSMISTSIYIFMGWMIVFFIKPLVENLSITGLNWLAAGGIAYTIGAILYSIKKIKFNHAIFHIFVLIGSICHIITVYFYVLPV